MYMEEMKKERPFKEKNDWFKEKEDWFKEKEDWFKEKKGKRNGRMKEQKEMVVRQIKEIEEIKERLARETSEIKGSNEVKEQQNEGNEQTSDQNGGNGGKGRSGKNGGNGQNGKNHGNDGNSKKLSIVLLVVLPSAFLWDKYFNSSVILRSVYAVGTLLHVAWKYYRIEKYADPDELHEWASEKIYKMMMYNKGMYIKMGQAIANQGSVFPMAYQKRFTKLYDEAPYDTWESVDKALKSVYGNDYETQIFKWVGHDAVASASIAQVHKAELTNGDLVAIKVQHDYISNQVKADMMTYAAMVKLYGWVFDMPVSFYAKYVADQTILETKFLHELENAERLRQYIKEDKSVAGLGIYIPRNYESLSSDQVLVSEWIDGVPLTDKQLLIDSKYDLTTIMHQFIKIFGQQIFKYGFVHCDPHPGNLLIRIHKGKQQLVILDHGLYVDMPEKFREEYATLWKHLFAFDRAGIKSIGESWGIKSIDMFATSIQLSPVKKEVMNEMKAKSQKQLVNEFLSDTSKVPLDLFFLGRTMRIIQTCNKNLGSPVNRINLLTGSALNSLIPRTDFSHYFTLLKLKTSLFVSTMVFWWFRLKQIWRGDKHGFKGLGLEDEIERYFMDMAKEMGMEMVVNDEIK